MSHLVVSEHGLESLRIEVWMHIYILGIHIDIKKIKIKIKLRLSVFILNRMSREGSPADPSESESVHGVEYANIPPQPVQELPLVMQQFLETLQ